jgi:hypothetical protein
MNGNASILSDVGWSLGRVNTLPLKRYIDLELEIFHRGKKHPGSADVYKPTASTLEECFAYADQVPWHDGVKYRIRAEAVSWYYAGTDASRFGIVLKRLFNNYELRPQNVDVVEVEWFSQELRLHNENKLSLKLTPNT